MFWALILGITTGMRTMTAIALVCWVAYLGYLPVEGTWAFWTAKLVSVIVFTAMALGEYVGDTLPNTPSRTDTPLLLARLSFGILVGVIIATTFEEPKVGGVLLGAIGAMIGTYGGYYFRTLGARIVRHDLPVALFESAVALSVAMYALQEIANEINRNAFPAVLRMPR